MIIESKPPILVCHVNWRRRLFHMFFNEIDVELDEKEEYYLNHEFPAQLFSEEAVVSNVYELNIHFMRQIRLVWLCSYKFIWWIKIIVLH